MTPHFAAFAAPVASDRGNFVQMGRLFAFVMLVLCAGFAFASPAAAQGISPTVYEGQSATLSIPVTASVGGRCQFAANGAPQGTYDAGTIDTDAWTHDFGFVIDCNAASRVAVTSQFGGLKNATVVTDPGYTALAPYTVALNLQGNTQSISDSCAVANLTTASTGACSFKGTASNTVGLRLPGVSQSQTGSYLRVSAPAYAGPGSLVSGQYTDTLTITIAAAP